jgi:hypothetical protein
MCLLQEDCEVEIWPTDILRWESSISDKYLSRIPLWLSLKISHDVLQIPAIFIHPFVMSLGHVSAAVDNLCLMTCLLMQKLDANLIKT